jgi:nucleoside-diphosphate-sugar epimerase
MASHLARRLVSDGENVVILSRSRSKFVGYIPRWDVVAHMTPPRPKGAGFYAWVSGVSPLERD